MFLEIFAIPSYFILSYFHPGVIFNTENDDEWGLAVSGSLLALRPDWLPWAAMSERAGRVKSRPDQPFSTAPPPMPEADHVTIRALCPCPSAPPPLYGHLRRRETLHGERSLSTPPCRFFSGDC
jgi:hypothetical protein